MELIDSCQRVDADDGEKLLATHGKIGRSELHLLHELVNPLKAGKVEVVQSHEYQQQVLHDRTEGLVEDEQIMTLCQHLLLDGGAKGEICSHHRHAQCVGKCRQEHGNASLFGKRGISALQHICEQVLQGLDEHVPYVERNPAHLIGFRQPAVL